MVGRRVRQMLVALTAICATVGWVPLAPPPAGAGSLDSAAAFLLDDSPMYFFRMPGAAPERDVPAAVAEVSLKTSKQGLFVDVTQLARFVPETESVSARLAFYPRGSSIRVAGGVEFKLGTDAVQPLTVELATAATATSAEVWKPSKDLAVVKVKYSFPTTKLEIDAKGKYAKMLHDPFTAVGLDLYTGANSTAAIQPSARVSIGDLSGAHPGLTAAQGNGIADDFSPQTWITRPVAPNLIMRVGKYLHMDAGPLAVYNVGPQNATVRLYTLGPDAEQVRLFVAPTFQAVQPGARFAPYTIVVFAPTDTTAAWRRGDAYQSSPVAGVEMQITKHKNDFVVRFPEKMSTDLVGAQVIVPGDAGKVLLATSLRHTF
jgi:hypothetical protein